MKAQKLNPTIFKLIKKKLEFNVLTLNKNKMIRFVRVFVCHYGYLCVYICVRMCARETLSLPERLHASQHVSPCVDPRALLANFGWVGVCLEGNGLYQESNVQSRDSAH